MLLQGQKQYAISDMKGRVREVKEKEVKEKAKDKDEDQHTIAGLKNTISRLQQKVTLLEDERANLVQGGMPC